MRKMIAAMQVSLDGYIEGRDGEVDWVGHWDDSYDLLPHVDACVLGGGMYAGYENYWMAILDNPEAILPLTGKAASPDEVHYAHFADSTPHFVLSKSLREVRWKTSTIVRDLRGICELKARSGKDIYVVGGATTIGSLMNVGLIDEIRVTVHPVVLGGGDRAFQGC